MVKLRESRFSHSGAGRSGIQRLVFAGKRSPGGITPTTVNGEEFTRTVRPTIDAAPP